MSWPHIEVLMSSLLAGNLFWLLPVKEPGVFAPRSILIETPYLEELKQNKKNNQ